MSQKYAAFNTAGQIIGFYDPKIAPVPGGVDSIPITDHEWAAAVQSQKHTVQNGRLVAPTPKTEEQQAAEAERVHLHNLKIDAQAALQKSDIVVLRAYEAGEPVPAEWINYRAALRSAVRGEIDMLPTAPAA